MRLVAVHGACNRCGCALHECECPERKAELFLTKADEYLLGLKVESDAGRCFDCLGRAPVVYVVRDEVWLTAWPTYVEDRKTLISRAEANSIKVKPRCLLCLSCLDNRLERPLAITDFTDTPINQGVFFGFELYRRSTNPPGCGLFVKSSKPPAGG